MAENLYVTGAEYGSGKSVIILAIMELLSRRSDNVGVFRPVIHTTPEEDTLLHLITTRYALNQPGDALYGCTMETALELVSAGKY